MSRGGPRNRLLELAERAKHGLDETGHRRLEFLLAPYPEERADGHDLVATAVDQAFAEALAEDDPPALPAALRDRLLASVEGSSGHPASG